MKQRNGTIWIVVLGFILNLWRIRIDLALALAMIYVFVQTKVLLEAIGTDTTPKIWQIVHSLGILLTGLLACFCLATTIGLNCINPKFKMHGSLITAYFFVNIIFPILYYSFITCVKKLQSYRQRGASLITWSLIALLYFNVVAKNPPADADEAGCLGISMIPIVVKAIPLIIFAYGIYLIRFKKENA